MAVQLQLRNDLAATWLSVNPTLAQGEVGIERDTRKLKVGDGATPWALLPYIVGSGASGATFSGPSVGSLAGFWVGSTPPPDASWIWIVTGAAPAQPVSIQAAAAMLGLAATAPGVQALDAPLQLAAAAVALGLATPVPGVVAQNSALALSLTAASLTVAVPVPGVSAIVAFTDAFNDSSLDATKWASITAGSGTVTEGASGLVVTSNTKASAAAVVYKSSFARASETRTYLIDLVVASQTVDASDSRPFIVASSATQPAVGVSSNAAWLAPKHPLQINVSAGGAWALQYVDTSGSGIDLGTSYTPSAGTTVRIEFSTTATQWRVRILNAADGTTVLKDWGWEAWSALAADAGPAWIVLGDPWTDWTTAQWTYKRFEAQ